MCDSSLYHQRFEPFPPACGDSIPPRKAARQGHPVSSLQHVACSWWLIAGSRPFAPPEGAGGVIGGMAARSTANFEKRFECGKPDADPRAIRRIIHLVSVARFLLRSGAGAPGD